MTRDNIKSWEEMPVDDLLDHLGFHCSTRNQLDDAAPVDNPELDAALRERVASEA